MQLRDIMDQVSDDDDDDIDDIDDDEVQSQTTVPYHQMTHVSPNNVLPPDNVK